MKLPHKKRNEASATMIQSLCLIVACCGLLMVTAYASIPAWWSSTGTGSQGAVVSEQVVTNSGVVTTNYVPDDYAVVTEGQVKQFTTRAVNNLNTNLTGGAGTNLNNLVAGWEANYATNGYNATNHPASDYQTMNVGQLKYIGNLVWGQLVTNGYTYAVPSWLAQNTNTDNSAALVGQLKETFDFDLTQTFASPTNMVVAVSGTQALLNWSETSADASYVIQESTNGTTWTTIGTSGVANFTATTLGLGTNYYFRVIADGIVASESSPSSSDQSPIITLTSPSGATLVP